MKKVILIGDSIRMGYDKYVKEALEGVAEVYYPSENCRFALNTLRFLHDWAKKGEWGADADLVHWNVGLWDCLELFGDGPLTPVEFYESIIPRIHKRIKMLFPNAKTVFATSTAVIEDKMSKDFKRHNSVIAEYNRRAVKALEGTGTVINDLFALTENCPASAHSDGVHFNNDEGVALTGNRVVEVICRELGIEPSRKTEAVRENYDTENIGY
jgi:hypothetical protein